MRRRFAFIETRLLWGGGLTAGDLGDAFGIARQNAQRTIAVYRRSHPRQMAYDRRQRRHIRAREFEINYISDDVARFLEYQRAVSHIAHFYDEPDWIDLPFTDADTLIRPFYAEGAVRALLQALRRETVVEIQYWAKTGARGRRISPHHLVFADGRYHVRAYCHEDLTFLDFVLTRVVAAVPVEEPWVGDASDQAWHRREDIIFALNPRLPESAQAAIELDYLTDAKGLLEIKGVREALAYYVRRRLLRRDWRFDVPVWVAIDGASREALR